MEIHEFSERYPDIRSKTSKSTRENEEPKDGKGGKNTEDGKGKDHQSSPPSRPPHQQTEMYQVWSSFAQCSCLSTSQHMLRQGRAAMAAFPNHNGRLALCEKQSEMVVLAFPGRATCKGGAPTMWYLVPIPKKGRMEGGWEEKGFIPGWRKCGKGARRHGRFSEPLRLSIRCWKINQEIKDETGESKEGGAPQWPLSPRRTKRVPDTPRRRSWRKILGNPACWTNNAFIHWALLLDAVFFL